MRAPLTAPAAGRGAVEVFWRWAGILGGLIGLVAISNGTLWIDETLTAVKAAAPSLAEWWRQMVQEKASDLQMPLYMLGIWVWEKVAGPGEWALRLANVPWFAAGTGAFAWGLQRPSHRSLRQDGFSAVFSVLVLLVSPFAWYYLDEARPYAMQLGSSLMIAGSLCRLAGMRAEQGSSQETRIALGLLAVGVIGTSGSSMLGMIWAGAALAAGFAVTRGVAALKSPNPDSTTEPALGLFLQHRALLAGSLLCLGCLGGYYLWTLTVGARATTSAQASLQSTLFIGYELLGFTGLGPGRLELRSAGARSLLEHWQGLSLFGLALLIVMLFAAREFLAGQFNESRNFRSRRWVVAAILLLPAFLLIGAGFIASFRVLGRHFTPLYPALALFLGSGLAALWRKPGFLGRATAILFLALSLVSCLQIRFASRHGKDDYRQAAAAGQVALSQGQVVWWNAAEQGARYYHLPVDRAAVAGKAARLIFNAESGAFENVVEPNLIITSKPDVYDVRGTLAEFIQRKGYVPVRELRAFVIWSRAGVDRGFP